MPLCPAHLAGVWGAAFRLWPTTLCQTSVAKAMRHLWWCHNQLAPSTLAHCTAPAGAAQHTSARCLVGRQYSACPVKPFIARQYSNSHVLMRKHSSSTAVRGYDRLFRQGLWAGSCPCSAAAVHWVPCCTVHLEQYSCTVGQALALGRLPLRWKSCGSEGRDGVMGEGAVQCGVVEVQRLLLEAYRLLEEGKVSEAELLVREGLLEVDELPPDVAAAGWDQCSLLAFLRGGHVDAHDAALRSLRLLHEARGIPPHASYLTTPHDSSGGTTNARGGTAQPPSAAEPWGDDTVAAEARGGNAAAAEARVDSAAGADDSRGNSEATEIGAAEGMAHLRIGAALTGRRRWQEAVPHLRTAHRAVATLSPAAAETHFFLLLCDLAQKASVPAPDETVAAFLSVLRQVRGVAGVGPYIMRAALREFHSLVDWCVEEQDYAAAERLYALEVELLEALGVDGKTLSLATYQAATFHLARGALDTALLLCEKSLKAAEPMFKPQHDQIVLRQHRIGTILLAQGDPGRAEPYLAASLRRFAQTLGDDNPLTGEARLSHALAALQLAAGVASSGDPFSKVLMSSRKDKLLLDVARGLEAMERGFGDDHLLVEHARGLIARVQAT